VGPLPCALWALRVGGRLVGDGVSLTSAMTLCRKLGEAFSFAMLLDALPLPSRPALPCALLRGGGELASC